MKFGKALETNAESMPEDWRPYVIHYKALKKKINAIVQELDDRGLPSPIIKTLLSQSLTGDMQRLEYSFDGKSDASALLCSLPEVPFAPRLPINSSSFKQLEDKEHLRTCIKVVLDDLDPSVTAEFGPTAPLSQDGQLSKLLAHELAFLNTSASSSSSDLQEQLLLAEDTDSLEGTEESVQEGSEAGEESEVSTGPISGLSVPRGSHGLQEDRAQDLHGPALVTKTPSPLSQPPLMRLSQMAEDKDEEEHDNDKDGPDKYNQDKVGTNVQEVTSTSNSTDIMEALVTPGASQAEDSLGKVNKRILTTEEDGKRVLVIELTADTAFFDQLGEEVSQLSKLQQANKLEFESKVQDLSKILTVVSSPHNKDMYTWREILKIYLDAQVFVGDQETDRSTRSSEKAQKQLQWFLMEMERSKLVHRFKQTKSKNAFSTFFQLNSELITMKQFKELNQMAMTKILKKHDKRTNLTASSGFPKHLQNEPFYNDNISKSLTYTIGCQLISIIPQPDDYACPICMSVAWKPIRLNCKHVFCVRCLIKAQRKKMVHCPVCRQTNSVVDADASNLDVSMMNFLKLYFPKEIKEKRKDSSREQAAEELEAITGQRWTEVPETACAIM